MKICSCGWKYEGRKCPMCGSRGNPKKKKENLAQAMREFVESRYPGYDGQPVNCDLCGHAIATIKYENIAHRIRRSQDSTLREDPGNLMILCGPTDYWGNTDKSCHTLYDAGKIKIE